MKLLFKYPTRARPTWFVKTLESYYQKISESCDFVFLVTLDSDDCTMNTYEMRKFLTQQPNLVYKYGSHNTKIEAVNADMNIIKDWDVLVLVSDDMIPIVQDFDRVITKEMQKHFRNLDGALHFDDGFLGRDQTITLTIMGRQLYEYFGYIYHPAYKSFYCDNEFTHVVRWLGKVVYIPKVIIKHEWKGGSKGDALYKWNSRHWKHDKETYKQRKRLGFPK